MNVTINTRDGYFQSLNPATSDFIMRKLLKAQGDRKNPISLRLAGEHWAEAESPATVRRGEQMGEKFAQDFKRNYPRVLPWTGAAGERR